MRLFVFFPRTTPLQVAPAQVRGLRLSLNTPVVSTEDLPVGPARAAILIHAEGGRGETVTIGIRSLRAARVAVFSIDPDVSGDASFDVTLDAALSFAESMGFLFDEDEMGDGGAQGKTRCLGLWRDLIGDDAAVGKSAPANAPANEELLLDELVEEATEAAVPPFGDTSDGLDDEIGDFGPPLAPELEERPVAAAARKKAVRASSRLAGRDRSEASDAAVASEVARAAAGGGGGRSAPLTLSKFRGGAGPAASSAASAASAAEAPGKGGRGGAALGRLRLVRRAKDGARKRNPILRLFGVF
jgi:hypothetical protein